VFPLFFWAVYFDLLNTSFRLKSWLREYQECAKLSLRQRVATLKNLKYKIYWDLFNTFFVTTWFHMCHFIVVMFSLLFYNVENSKDKKTPWMSRCVQNLWLILYIEMPLPNVMLVLVVTQHTVEGPVWCSPCMYWVVIPLLFFFPFQQICKQVTV
jgi:hypothetical protein